MLSVECGAALRCGSGGAVDDGMDEGWGGCRCCLAVCWGWRFYIGRLGDAGKCTWSHILKVVATEVPSPGSYHPIDPSPVLGRVSYRAFLAFLSCRFLPIAHGPSALPSKFSPVINSPFLSSCLLLTTFPPFRFLFLSVTFTFAKSSTHFNQPRPTRPQSPSPLPFPSPVHLSPHIRFVATQRRILEPIRRADQHRQASQNRNPLPDYRHSLAPPRPWLTDVQTTKDPNHSPLKRRFQDPSYVYENLASS
ncbi:hypothetical protein BDP55DRAFT_411759 [Colletotrichum godetiae]|uniref:Uncharacterized protein n=1 Tax=Colletotrichum godetiae TaxID=1209918 RepID=A0AAJ0ASI8_9PEZI|nr:uncharacterized protein BDP55DRAFT_411759 [Colletotrichum godetiae]KAK1689580.1 hypothetical protein BDP55DRAFT_411759 [Colletotrichum godetiae]